jgi:hypothetical protein
MNAIEFLIGSSMWLTLLFVELCILYKMQSTYDCVLCGNKLVCYNVKDLEDMALREIRRR